MSSFEMVCGLETHVQLATQSKLFCPCPTDGIERAANSRVCPVCTGQPGVLPVLNRAAVERAFRAGLALSCRIEPESVFARKNYFYPDLPKAYQISQYEKPFALAGFIEIPASKNGGLRRVRILRAHLEEDAGKLLHEIGSQEIDGTLVDFNRAGLPLIEIVTEPDIFSSEQAYEYLQALKEILQYAEVSRCDMEKGEMRVDANISLRLPGGKLGTRTEIKNLNSFKAVRDALDYETARQAEVLKRGEAVVQETRQWDSAACETRPMRGKEEAHDYRYFPDPDLPPLAADADWVARIKKSLPELPRARRERLIASYGLSAYDAGLLTSSKALADYFEAAARGKSEKALKTAANLISTEFLAKLNAESLDVGAAQDKIPPQALAGLVDLIEQGEVSKTMAKDIFSAMWASGRDAAGILKEKGGGQISDEGQLREWIRQALGANPKAADDLRQGKDRAAGAIVGAVMKMSRGKANPGLVSSLIKEEVHR